MPAQTIGTEYRFRDSYRRDNILLCACVHLLRRISTKRPRSRQSSHSFDPFLSPFSEWYASRDAYCKVIDLPISHFICLDMVAKCRPRLILKSGWKIIFLLKAGAKYFAISVHALYYFQCIEHTQKYVNVRFKYRSTL